MSEVFGYFANELPEGILDVHACATGVEFQYDYAGARWARTAHKTTREEVEEWFDVRIRRDYRGVTDFLVVFYEDEDAHSYGVISFSDPLTECPSVSVGVKTLEEADTLLDRLSAVRRMFWKSKTPLRDVGMARVLHALERNEYNLTRTAEEFGVTAGAVRHFLTYHGVADLYDEARAMLRAHDRARAELYRRAGCSLTQTAMYTDLTLGTVRGLLSEKTE